MRKKESRGKQRTARSAVNAIIAISAWAMVGSGTSGAQGVTRIDTVPAPSLAANLLGDPAWRQVSVYLPPSYARERGRRYPVVYWLHGFTSTDRELISGIRQNLHIRLAMDSLVRAGSAREMIIVMPNGHNAFGGSYFANSPVTGKWEDFIVRDLVRWTDSRYRTVRARSARGIAGHSMGGFGALRIAMRNPDTFSAVYAMSPCCLDSEAFFEKSWLAAWRGAAAVRTREEFRRASFRAQLLIARAAMFSPDTSRPPVYVALPVVPEGDSLRLVPGIAALWRNDPMAMVPGASAALRRLAIAVDAGGQDGFPDIPANARALDSLLTAMRIAHTVEVYPGGHGDKVRERIVTRVLPFFARVLK
ncbi:MAG TPA: alpha/beta hydrolase-fold protein [Gemmatimonadaceae bacterium]|nr:alpha/beta hydrolase-fold protein [Gemmatimonadaceae bacterium]